MRKKIQNIQANNKTDARFHKNIQLKYSKKITFLKTPIYYRVRLGEKFRFVQRMPPRSRNVLIKRGVLAQFAP